MGKQKDWHFHPAFLYVTKPSISYFCVKLQIYEIGGLLYSFRQNTAYSGKLKRPSSYPKFRDEMRMA